jgi:hypothetical protein
MEFRLLIELEALEYLDMLPPRRRSAIFGHIRRIREYPGNYSVAKRQDPEGRLLDVASFAGLQIVYWIDHADRHIKILYVEEND